MCCPGLWSRASSALESSGFPVVAGSAGSSTSTKPASKYSGFGGGYDPLSSDVGATPPSAIARSSSSGSSGGSGPTPTGAKAATSAVDSEWSDNWEDVSPAVGVAKPSRASLSRGSSDDKAMGVAAPSAGGGSSGSDAVGGGSPVAPASASKAATPSVSKLSTPALPRGVSSSSKGTPKPETPTDFFASFGVATPSS